MATVGQSLPGFKLDIADVRYSSFDGPTQVPTYILAKHACGPATDIILDRIGSGDIPNLCASVIATCCHGTAQECIPSALASSGAVTPSEWHQLAKFADWVTASGVPEEIATIGRVAMRVMDCLRITALPDHISSHVTELFPSSVSRKNHGIVMTT